MDTLNENDGGSAPTRPSIDNFVQEAGRPLILGVWSSKGGVGKTTISTNIADTLAHHYGLRVAMIDRDTQGSLKVIKRRANELDLKTPYDIYEEMPTSIPDVDVVVFDHAPRLGEEFIPYEFTDLVLAATRPSFLDVESLKDCLEVLSAKKIQTLGVLNCFKSQISDHRATQLSRPDFSIIPERNAYPVSMRCGSGVFTAQFPKEEGRTKYPSGLKEAQAEMLALIERIGSELNIDFKKSTTPSGDNQ